MISSNTEPRPWATSTSHSTAPSSQPLWAAYISQVIAVQAASPAAAARVGEGPRSAPPRSAGSSITIVWPLSISTSCV